MNMQEFKIFKDQNNSNLKFDFSLKNLNWMNIGGSAKVFFKPENLKELISFLKIVPKYKKHVLGAGSNLLISEKLGEKIFIKLVMLLKQDSMQKILKIISYRILEK